MSFHYWQPAPRWDCSHGWQIMATQPWAPMQKEEGHLSHWYLAVILRGRAGYELIYITNEAVGRVGYYQLISGNSEKNNCFSKFSSNSLDFFGWNLLKSWHFLYRRRHEKIFFPTSKISAQEIRYQFCLIWSNSTIMAHIMGLGNQSESWKIIILS